MKTKLLTFTLITLMLGLLSSCKKDNGFTTPEEGSEMHNVEGALKGEFSVSDTRKVHFSQGNLYWNGEEFRFETNQYEFQDPWNASHVGHFFWSTVAPIAYAEEYNWNNPSGGAFFTNATAETAKADFTVNGVTGKYRTLSAGEWTYVFYTTSRMKNHKTPYTVGCITIESQEYEGVFLYPDNYNGHVVSSSMTWEQINAAGIVFLPAAGGRRDGFHDFSNGLYWSSTRSHYVSFDNIIVSPDDVDNYPYFGYSVRLVTDAN